MTALLDEQLLGCDKLQSHKSSFQAWKCVSFGCSLLAILLLLSKWHEVSTDLHLLVGIDRILSLQSAAASTNRSPSDAQPELDNSTALSWPPVPLDQLLPAANETDFGMSSMDSNNSMLMSHMHISLSRELTGNQLLLQEVNSFIVEFRNAKATLSLSCLLVSIYIISWILMTLAINDTRISNDISLRNILLLSVFGAIDIAASVGFVMVRLIMYSVKNNSFASLMLSTSGLKDTPVRLTSDQLTAFTALRLIAMRSCSAHVDVYVSVLVTLLTILRLYAILRALTFYRHLRRVNDRQSLLSLADAQLQIQQFQPPPPVDAKQLVWTSASPSPQPMVLQATRPGSISMQPQGGRASSGRGTTRPTSYAGRRRKSTSSPTFALPMTQAKASTMSRAAGRRAPERRQQVSEFSPCAGVTPLPPRLPSPPVHVKSEPEVVVMKSHRVERRKAHSDVEDIRNSSRVASKISPSNLHEVLASLQVDSSSKPRSQQFTTGSYTILSGTKSATLGKYRLVARYKPVLSGTNKGATMRSEPRTSAAARRRPVKQISCDPLHLIEEFGAQHRSTSDGSGPTNSPSSSELSEGSTCGPDDSDNSSAHVGSRRTGESRSFFTSSPVSALCQTEEFIADNLRGQQVFELAPTGKQTSGNTVLLGKYYYA